MRNKNIIMLLMSSLILSGCGPQPENKESQQQQPSTPTEQQVLAAQQAAIKEAEQRRRRESLGPARSATIFRQTGFTGAIAGSANICKSG